MRAYGFFLTLAGLSVLCLASLIAARGSPGLAVILAPVALWLTADGLAYWNAGGPKP